MAWVPAAQAVQIVSFGPCSPKRIEMAAPAALAIIIGTRNGETRRSPFSIRTTTCSSRVCSPPTPVPKIVPNRAGSTPRSPAWAKASVAAAMANCSTRSARRASFGVAYQGVGSQSSISVARPDVMPGPSRPFQNASRPMPHGATTPSPVTATRPALHQSLPATRS